METKYSKAQLQRVRAQSIVYQCACPAQVSTMLSSLLSLYEYQESCIDKDDVDVQVHRRIADATAETYRIMEQCFTDVLQLEGWNLETLEMPELLRNRLIKQISEN